MVPSAVPQVQCICAGSEQAIRGGQPVCGGCAAAEEGPMQPGPQPHQQLRGLRWRREFCQQAAGCVLALYCPAIPLNEMLALWVLGNATCTGE